MPKVSIITINYNDAAGLEKTLQSAAAQSFRDFEHIVIDGGSTDGSVEVIKRYADKIAYWVSEKDRGIYHAQNKGIEKSTGEYCLFLNSGDHLADEKVLENVFKVERTNDIVYGDMIIDYGNGKTAHGKMPEHISFYQMYTDTLWHPVSFIKRELFAKFGMYDEQFKMVADYDFFFRVIIMEDVCTLHVPVEIAVYNLNGLSSRPKFKAQEKEERKAVLYKYLPPLMIEYFTQNIVLPEPGKKSIVERIINRLK